LVWDAGHLWNPFPCNLAAPPSAGHRSEDNSRANA